MAHVESSFHQLFDTAISSRGRPLDPSIYNLDKEEGAFFKKLTGIRDDNKLQAHILQIQAEAYAVYPYPCIRRLAFTAFKISRYPAYQAVLKLGQERKGALLLDLGCCFGNDARKVISDGFPLENVIASDLHPEFWDLGNKLFKQSTETFPVSFLPGDIFDPSFLSPDVSPAPSSSALDTVPIPSLSRLTSLTPLKHHISIIHTGAFFHLFGESQQRRLAHLLAKLLSPLPGSMILGSHMGLPDTEDYKAAGGLLAAGNSGDSVYAHCPTSWKNLWAGSDGVFKPQDVIVWATAKEVERKVIVQSGEAAIKAHMLVWSVTRV